MKLLRKILLPIVPIYFAITWLRNQFYDWGWKSSKAYDLPIICVGNLSTGGTGKTPTIEYLIRLLKTDHHIATLSRGYKRETTGFLIADENASAKTLGDEPFQFYSKFKDITVSVDANRQHGIQALLNQKQPDVILLDDAFQHRKVTPGFTILLTSFGKLYSDDIVLPTGNLREPRWGARRADVILVTKCPKALSEAHKQNIRSQLNIKAHQEVFFSTISHSDVIFSAHGTRNLNDLREEPITVVTGIANPQPFIAYLKSKAIEFEHLKFKDHHDFTSEDIATLKQRQVILTTEKDYVRLKPHFETEAEHLFYLPIAFTIDRKTEFDTRIKNYVLSH